jgi:hypothetical protein
VVHLRFKSFRSICCELPHAADHCRRTSVSQVGHEFLGEIKNAEQSMTKERAQDLLEFLLAIQAAMQGETTDEFNFNTIPTVDEIEKSR